MVIAKAKLQGKAGQGRVVSDLGTINSGEYV